MKGWNASYKFSLISGQAADLACSVTVEFPREAQTRIWTESHAFNKLQCCGGGCGTCAVANLRGLFPGFPGLIGG
jgi:hypothetical protein